MAQSRNKDVITPVMVKCDGRYRFYERKRDIMFRQRMQITDTPNEIEKLRKVLDEADAVIIGAGAGLSTSAGYIYTGERFNKYFYDFRDKYGIRDIYSGGFYPFPDMETYWAWWSRHIWVNRYVPIPNDVYDRLLNLVRGKDYFASREPASTRNAFSIRRVTMACCRAPILTVCRHIRPTTTKRL